MPGIYAHIPFCRSRCIYCGFYSTTCLDLRTRYVRALCREMELRKDYIGGTFNTIYLGGGTPSQLDPADIGRLLAYIYKVYRIADDAEAKPSSATPTTLPRHSQTRLRPCP